MKKFSQSLFRALITGLVLSFVSFFLRLASPAESARQELFTTISYYCFAITVVLLAAHLITLLVVMASRPRQNHSKEI